MPTFQVDSPAELGFPQLLRMAVKRLAIDYEKETESRHLWLDERPHCLHHKVKELQERLGGAVPALARLHFLDKGPFPYSREIAEALEILQQSGAIIRENPNYTRFSPRIFADTRETLEPEIEHLFPKGSAEREAFEGLVDGLRDLVTEE